MESGVLKTYGMEIPVITAKITRYGPEQVEILADSSEGGILVLTDLFHPFWTASVDGEPVDLFPALHIFRGLKLAKGRHRIEFVCRIPYFSAGVGVSLAALAIWSWLAFGYGEIRNSKKVSSPLAATSFPTTTGLPSA